MSHIQNIYVQYNQGEGGGGEPDLELNSWKSHISRIVTRSYDATTKEW